MGGLLVCEKFKELGLTEGERKGRQRQALGIDAQDPYLTPVTVSTDACRGVNNS